MRRGLSDGIVEMICSDRLAVFLCHPLLLALCLPLALILKLAQVFGKNAVLPRRMIASGNRIARLISLVARGVDRMRLLWAKLRGHFRRLQLLRTYTISVVFDEATGAFTVSCRNELMKRC